MRVFRPFDRRVAYSFRQRVGIALWTLFGVIMAFVTYLVYRNGEKVGEFASKMLFRARKTHAYRKERRKGLQKKFVCGNISKINLE